MAELKFKRIYFGDEKSNCLLHYPFAYVTSHSEREGTPTDMKMLHFKTGPHLLSLNRKVVPQMQHVDFLIPNKMMGRKCVSLGMGCGLGRFSERTRTGRYAVLLGAGDTEVSTSEFDDFSVMRGASGSNELKISVSVSGAKTQEIFDKVFSRMVLDAQPIPGFRRVKGGKTPDIPRDILLEILGYSKVYKQVIKKIINSTISKYVEKDGLIVSKDLQIEQSFEDLEAIFEPGDPFTFSAIVQRQHPQ